jgi:hypothetical protein
MIYTYYEGKLWRTDVATGDQMLLHDLEISKLDKIGDLMYLDGVLYFAATRNGEKLLAQMDPQTGGWAYVIKTPIASYSITNDAIYYVPADHRQVNDPQKYPTSKKGALYASFADSVYACDHNGDNVRKVWTDESGVLNFASYFTVVDGVHYGYFSKFDAEENAWGTAHFGELHYDTGEIISTYKGW